jgi:hypothetical protein
MLWRLGYRELVAVDWSDAAWARFVDPASVPRSVRAQRLRSPTAFLQLRRDFTRLHYWRVRRIPRVLQVTFYALDDQRFLDGWLAAQRGDAGKFDTIVFNYAVSIAFAISVLEAMP